MSRAVLKPYVSVLLARRRDGADAGADAGDLVEAILDDLAAELDLGGDTSPATLADRSDSDADGDGPRAGHLHYILRRRPGWTSDATIVDVWNHLVVVLQRGALVAIYTSDKALGTTIGRLLRSLPPVAAGLAALEPIEPGVLNAGLLRGPSKTLWLSGIHRRSAHKADSKVLAGLDLQFALDPLDDQSYYFTAARAAVELSEDLPQAVGVAPRKSRAWVGPSRDWPTFQGVVVGLLDVVAAVDDADATLAPLPVLAAPAEALETVADAFDVSVVPPDLLADVELDDQDRDDLDFWANQARFEVTETDGANFTVELHLDQPVGTIDVTVEIDDTGQAKLELEPDGDDDQLAAAATVLGRPDWTTIRYDSGHAIGSGLVYEMRLRDFQFTGWDMHDMTGYDVEREKPTVPDHPRQLDVAAIGHGTSLFDWVVHTWLAGADWHDDAWLVCDDGAMEIADFVAVDPAERLVTLIHVKGSGSTNPNRGVSVADYEVVGGQTVKNLARLDRETLEIGLERNRANDVAAATWHGQQRQADREELLHVVAGLGANLRRDVVIVQPRVTQTALAAARKDVADGNVTDRVTRMRQLEHLLVGIDARCRALGASLSVMGDNA